MKKIVMIGGVDPNTTLDSIDEEIIRLTNKKEPKILFVPTASGDDHRYCDRYKAIYEGKFGCKLDVLYLINESPAEDEIREKVFSSDVVYIGGGPTSVLMENFKKYKMNNILEEACEKGIVLAGISSGAICMGRHYYWTAKDEFNFLIEGFSDYEKFDCFGFFNFIVCPHFNLDGRNEKLDLMIKEYNVLGLGLDNNCAIEFVDNTYRVITSKDYAKAYRVYVKDAQKVKEVINRDSEFRSIGEIVDVG